MNESERRKRRSWAAKELAEKKYRARTEADRTKYNRKVKHRGRA